MSEIISCPECDRKLRVAENLLGKKVRCPGCSLMFTAGGYEPPDEAVVEKPRARRHDDEDDDRRSRRRDDDDEDDRPSRRRRDDDDEDDDRGRRRSRRDDDEDDRPRKPRNERKAWRQVVLGLKLTVFGVWVGVAGTLIGGLCMILVGAFGVGVATLDIDTAMNTGIILILMAGLKGLCTLGELSLIATGAGFTMTIPPSRNAPLKPLGITAFVLAAAYAGFTLLGDIVGFSSSGGSYAIIMPIGGGGGGMLLLLGEVIGLAYLIVFLIFLRHLGRAARVRELGEDFMRILIGFAIYYGVATALILVAWLVFVGSMFSSAKSGSFQSARDTLTVGSIIMAILGCLVVLASAGLHVWYAITMMKLRDAVDRHAHRMGTQ